MSRPRATCWPRSRRHCPPTSPCSAPPWPTGASTGEGAEKMKKDGGGPPALSPGREPRHPRHRRAAHRRAARPRGRLRRRDREGRRARPGQAGPQGLRLDRRQRCQRRRPASWAATATRCISSRGAGVEILADHEQGRGRSRAGRADRRRPEGQADGCDDRGASGLPHAAGLPLPKYETRALRGSTSWPQSVKMRKSHWKLGNGVLYRRA